MNKAFEKNLEIEKIKVASAEIVVHGTSEKPYYEIRYYDISDGKYHIGYSSYDLSIVFGWLKECFEIVQEVAEEYNNGWIPCSEKLPEEAKTTGYVEEDYVDGKLTEYIVMILGTKKPTTLYYAGDGHWYDVASQEYYPVIAWQPLPEQYEEH